VVMSGYLLGFSIGWFSRTYHYHHLVYFSMIVVDKITIVPV